VALAAALTFAITLLVAPNAGAAVTKAFDGAVDCGVQADGTRACSGIVSSFDGAPIDVNLRLPAAPASGTDGDYPLVMEFHGWGGSKLNSYKSWTDSGYAYFSVSDRGWGNSCGGTDPKRLQPVCANGFNHLLDTRYEVRDVQELVGRLVDDGLVDPQKIATFGSSYGGGLSMALAALKNRKMLVDDSLVPWTSPDGTPISIAAAAPDIPWSDLAYSLMPNGRTLDYVADAPYDAGPIGIMKQTFVSGLFGIGLATSNYAPPGTYADADLINWYSLITAGEPYDPNPLAADIVDEIVAHHSSYYIDNSVMPPPMLISNGWTDDLFPVDEALRFYNHAKDTHPNVKISMFFSDHGHQRGQNKVADQAVLRQRVHSWFDYYVLGQGSEPQQGVETLTTTCGTPSGGPYTAPTWRALAPGEVRLDSAPAQLISPAAGDPTVNQAYDPISGPGACATASAADQPGLANYRLPPAPAGGYTLMGSPTIVADVLSPGPNSQIAARLVDVDPDGNGTLVARGLYRVDMNTAAKRIVFQLHPNGYHFAAGHIPKLELMPDDFPYSRRTNGQLPVTVSNLEMRLPVREQPGTAGAQTPRPKVLPAGYHLAPDYIDAPVDSDGDGVPDGTDACPNVPGPGTPNGCPAPPTDTDGDGTPDSTDACPTTSGPPTNNGCPVTDTDGDGIPDSTDACPNDPGPESNNGCPVAEPDTDGDGIPDSTDACPTEAGPESNNGCPVIVPPPTDTDGDGIPDSTDACPNDPGPGTPDGCPAPPTDTDGDGIPDSTDACPNEPGPESNNGCPVVEPPPRDSDGDGIPNDEDSCPARPGPASNNGCPVEEPPGPCETKILGTGAADRLDGTTGSETIRGRAGGDRIKARAGNDCVGGQSGDDSVNGGAGRDDLSGGSGDDRLQAVDGDRDTIDCGAGKDKAVIDDTGDKTENCERVVQVGEPFAELARFF
jgi:hypothetical protein